MNAQRNRPTGGLYLLTPDEQDTGRLVARVAPLLGEGVAMLQLRNKSGDRRLLREQALALQPLCRAAAIPLLINDDWRLAAAIGADGAHLGAMDGALAEARAALGEGALLGASCYGDLERARAACVAGADYLAFGAFFPSGSKPLARQTTPAVLRDARHLGRPTVAIGGITPDNAHLLVSSGADFLAVIGAVFDAPDPVAAVRAFRRCFPTSPE